MTPSRKIQLALCVLVIAGLQLGMTGRELTSPFLDGRSHYDIDNADFTIYARDGIRLGEPRTQLGITQVRHAAWGVPAGEPAFYTHHPFLLKAGFQLWVRAFGDAEWVSRSFALLVAGAAAIGIFVALSIATGDLLAALLAGVVLVGVPVFAIFQACLKYELDGMAAGAWFFVAVALHLRAPSRARLAAVALLAATAVLAHWTGALFVAAVAAWLGFERVRNADRSAGRAAAAAVGGAASGALAVFAVFAWLRGGWGAFARELASAAASRSDASDVSLGEWWARQVDYVAGNFGAALLASAGVVAAALVVRSGLRWRAGRARRGSIPPGVPIAPVETSASPGDGSAGPGAPRRTGAADRLVPGFVLSSLATALAWQLGFPQGSYVHVFWQLWFSVPLAAVFAAAVVAARPRRTVFVGVVAGTAALGAWLQVSARAEYGEVLRERAGTPGDVEFLSALRGDTFSRMVLVPWDRDPLAEWFVGPVFDYYTDRSVAVFDGTEPVHPGEKVLIIREPRQEAVAEATARYLGLALEHPRCGPRFCAYDAVAPAAVGAVGDGAPPTR